MESSTLTGRAQGTDFQAVRDRLRGDVGYQAFLLLRIGFVAAPILFGLISLLTLSGYYDIALRDFGLMLWALTLARLASRCDPPGLEVRP